MMKFGKAKIRINLSAIKNSVVGKQFDEDVRKVATKAKNEIAKVMDSEYAVELSKRTHMKPSLKSSFRQLIGYKDDVKLLRSGSTGVKPVGTSKIKEDDFFYVRPRLKRKKAEAGTRSKNMSVNDFHGLWHIHEYNRTRSGKTTIYPKGTLLAFPHRSSGLPDGASPRNYEGQWVDVFSQPFSIFIDTPPKERKTQTRLQKPELKRGPRTGIHQQHQETARNWKKLSRPQITSGKQVEKMVSFEGKKGVFAQTGKQRQGRVLFVGLPSLPVKSMTKYTGSVGPFQKAMNSTRKQLSFIVKSEFEGRFGKYSSF